MRAHSTIDRNYSTCYDSGPCPTWMKTLEEKYKRLHMKVVYNTSVNRCRSRPFGAYSTISGGILRNSRLNRISQRLPATQIYRPQTALRLKTNVATKNQNKDIILDKVNQNEDTEECVTTTEDDIQDENIDINIESKSSVFSGKESIEITMDNQNVIKSEKGLVHSDGGNGNRSNILSETVVSKTKSCPPTLQRQQPLKMREPAREELERADNKRKSKLFQRMSKEAQTAINETLSEIKNGETGGRESMRLFNNFTNDPRTSRTEYHGRSSTLNKTQFERPKSCVAQYSSTSSSRSSASSGTLKNLRPHLKDTSNRLPEIISARTDSTWQSAGHRNVLVPGVGKYSIPLFKEQTFQVTGAEYDIRYREVIHCGGRDSVTPPSDILEQAIMKCQEWLTRYAVYVRR